MSKIMGGDRDQLRQYLRLLADRMGLRDWEVCLEKGPPENPEHQACVQVAQNRKYATVWVSPKWPKWTSDHLRQTVTHELVHLHFEPLRNGLTPVGEHFSMLTWNVFYRFYERDLEYAVEAIACAWAETLPLPGHVELEAA